MHIQLCAFANAHSSPVEALGPQPTAEEKINISLYIEKSWLFIQTSSGSMEYIINLIRQSKGGDIEKAIAEKLKRIVDGAPARHFQSERTASSLTTRC